MLQINANDTPQPTMQSIAISETRHGNPQKTDDERDDNKKVDQDDVLPAKRKASKNNRAADSNGFTSQGSKENTSQGEPSINASLQRKAKRSAVVKNPRKGPASPRDSSPGSDQGGVASVQGGGAGPFGKKQSAATQ